jgi:3-methyladenine DNA glycosylase/8-oxoguanine DNA glycosylase
MASLAHQEKFLNEVITPSINALKEDDLKMGFDLNDPNNQMQFRVSIIPGKIHLEEAKKKAIDWDNYLRNTVYDKNGNFLPAKAAQIILKNDYFDEYAQSVARQSVNAERRTRVAEKRNNYNGGRDLSSFEPSNEIDALMRERLS